MKQFKNLITPSIVEIIINYYMTSMAVMGLNTMFNIMFCNKLQFTRIQPIYKLFTQINYNKTNYNSCVKRNINTGQIDKSAQFQVLKDEDKQKQQLQIGDLFDKINNQIDNNIYQPCFAIVHIFGTQYLIHPSDIILIKHSLGADIGDRIKLEKCLLVGNADFTLIGRPLLNRDFVQIEATVLEKTMSHTYYIVKAKPKQHGFRRWLFKRYPLTTLRINNITICHRLNESQSQVQ